MSRSSTSTSRPLAGRLISKMRRVAGAALRRRQQGPYKGYVDGMINGELHGWVVRQPGNSGGIKVGLYVSDGLLASAIAVHPRADVAASGIGTVDCGFVFRLPSPLLRAIDRAGGRVTIKALEDDVTIGSCQVSDGTPSDDSMDDVPGLIFDRPLSYVMTACRSVLYGELVHLAGRLEEVPATMQARTARPEKHGAMFSHAAPARDPQPDMADPSAVPAYLDYTRFRTRKDREFHPDEVAIDLDHFLLWYLEAYSTWRGGRRVPLSRDMIAYLNAPVPMGGQHNTLTRVMWWRLLSCSPYRHHVEPNNPDWYGGVVFWWAQHDVRALYMEDCLVPKAFRDFLRVVPNARQAQKYPFSVYMDRFLAEQTEFHFLDGGREEDRKLLLLCLMVIAARRPDILAYLPAASVEAMLSEEDGPCALETFYCELTGVEIGQGPSRARYTSALRLQGYDLDSQSFLSITDDGHRFEAAALPCPAPGDPVDLQMIGPFKKASGLGQATRLSASVLAQTSLNVNHVDFGLDNPAPEGFSRVGTLEEYRNAKINLIHLNAESIPLVFAYEPDVFSDAYNIGYFYWELDTPAACHYLGMEMLDEIWVSSQYGVDIYQPQTDKPVINVGMCFEALEDIDRPAARADLDRKFRFKGDEFVCLVAFDSFSFVQRKNPVGVLKAFQQGFRDVPEARLIIKTQNRENVSDPVQDKIWKQVTSIMDSDPRIHLLNETLSYDALLRLKAASDCYISLHKSEGWGFGMIEAMNLKVPVVCTGYSGNLEFCNEDTAWLVDYKIVALDQNDYIFVRKGQQWAEPDIADAARQLHAVYADPDARAQKVAVAHDFVQERFSASAIALRYEDRLTEIIRDLDPSTPSRPAARRKV